MNFGLQLAEASQVIPLEYLLRVGKLTSDYFFSFESKF
jgi:hypothetical protein